MRKKIIAGNWKMNTTASQTTQLISELKKLTASLTDCDIVICPPAINIPAAFQAISGTNIKLGAQNIHWEEFGAFTGEISAKMLKEYGVEYAIIGHSERRSLFGETNEGVNKRAQYSLQNGITPIICVGETLTQHEAGKTNEVVTTQTLAALSGLTVCQVEKVIIAYEPIWAIGTGKTATGAEANSTIAVIRKAVADTYGNEAAQAIRIQYGGSMNENNAQELLSNEHIDGGLIGGASLKAEKFAAICKAACNA